MEILVELFGSQTLVKVIRLFYLNPEGVFEAREISRRVRSSLDSVRRELRILERVNFVKVGSKLVDELVKTKKRAKRKRIRGLVLNKAFAYFQPLKKLVLTTAPVDRDAILARLKKGGRLTLVVLSGIFVDQIGDEENYSAPRLDILVVGDAIKKTVVDNAVQNLEAQIGKELNYSVLPSKEFLYRLRMRDKFIRNILDYPHEKILNKLDV